MAAEAPGFIPDGPLSVGVEIVSRGEEEAQQGVFDGITERFVLPRGNNSPEPEVHQVTFSWHHLIGTGEVAPGTDKGVMQVIDGAKRQRVADVVYTFGTAETTQERVARSAAAFGTVVRHLVNVVGSRPVDVLQLTVDDPAS